MSAPTQRTLEVLESLVDKTNMADVVNLLSEIADLKEQHVLENWQDRALASAWRRVSAKLRNCAVAVHKEHL